MGSNHKRKMLIKLAFVGIATMSGVINLAQVKLATRVISEEGSMEIVQHVSAHIQYHSSNEDGPNGTIPLPSSNEEQQPENNYIRRNVSIQSENLAVFRPPGTARIANRTKKATFKIEHPKFSENLIDEFIVGAQQAAIWRQKKYKQLKLQQKRKKKKRTKDKQNKKTAKVTLKVPTPIFVPSLPKSGTSTTHEYFQCGGQKSAHLTGRNEDGMFKIGRCAQRNFREGRDPFVDCGDYDVWTDTGYVAARYRPDGEDLRKKNIQCFYPLIDALEQTYAAHPNATFLFVVRETESWLNSIKTYHDGFIMDVWKRCRTRGFPDRDGTLADFREFYEWHKDMIQTFALDHPSWTYIEVDLESSETGQILEERIGIDAECWGHFNKGASNKDSKPDVDDVDVDDKTDEDDAEEEEE